MEFYGLSESIECDSAEVIAKKIMPSPPLNHEVFGKCLKYSCKRDGQAQIKRELNPKKTKCQNSLAHLNLGDIIKGKEFYVLVKGFKPEKLKKIHFSGAHNARQFVSHDYTFAEISTPFSGGNNIIVQLPESYISPLKQLTSK